jgi:hypothetical protein
LKVSLILTKPTHVVVKCILHYFLCHEEMNKGNALVFKVTNVNKKYLLEIGTILSCLTVSTINREFYLAKGTEKFILGRYLLSGILLLILLSLRPWGVAARPAILENRGAKSHFCDYFIIRARYLYLSY